MKTNIDTKNYLYLLALILLFPFNIYGQSAPELQEKVEHHISELKNANQSPEDFPDGWAATPYFNTLRAENNLDEIYITDVKIGINNDLWVLANGLTDPEGTVRKAFLTKFNESWETVHEFEFSNIISTFNLPLYVNSNGDVWFTDDDNLLKLAGGATLSIFSFEELGFVDKSPNESIVDIIEDQDGVVWMLTAINRLLGFHDGELEIFDNENSPMAYPYYTTSIFSENFLAVTNSGLWIKHGSMDLGGGVIRKQGETWEVFTKENSDLPANYVTGIVAQNPDHLWISTRPYEYNPDAVLGDDNLWLDGGLAEIQGDEWIIHTSETGLYSNYNRVLTTQSDEYVWVQFGDDSSLYDLSSIGILAEYDGDTWDKVLDYNEINLQSMVATDDELKWVIGDINFGPKGLLTLNETYLNFIKKPLPNRGYLSGDEFELTWEAGRKIDSVRIQFTNDQQSWFSDIALDIDVNDESYVYTFPEELSNGVQLKIIDEDRSNIYDTTGHFSIFDPSQVQYHLRKEFPNNTVELFDPKVHGWNFGNTYENMWPEDAWVNRDPYEGALGAFPINGVKSDFPSWDLMNGAFGEEETYIDILNSQFVRPSAALVWWALKSNGWQGTCHGFAVSSLITFTEGASRLPAYGVQTEEEFLYNVPLADDNRFLINKFWTQQWSIDHLPGIILNALADDVIEQLISGNISFDSLADNEDLFTRPSETLELIKEMLERKNPGDYHNNLTLINPDNVSGAHSILPYKAEQSTTDPNVWYVYVYDSNYPGDTNKRIAINTESNEWVYENVYLEDTTIPKFQGSAGLFLSDRVDNYKTTSRLLKENQESNSLHSQIHSLEDIGYFYTLKSPNTNLTLTDKNGRTTRLEAGVITSDIPGAFPITPLTGDLADPVGYFLFEENYDITLDYKQDQTEGNFIVASEESFYSFSNLEADQQNPDRLKFGKDLTIYTANKEQDYKFDLSIIDENDNQNKMYNLKNTAISSEDSISVFLEEAGDLVVDNFGGVGNFTLEIKEALTEDFFYVENFSLSESSSYKLSPDWNDLTGQNLIVQVDTNMDGTYDEVFEVSPETPVSIETNESSNIPANFELQQNYPNPFNPTTNIGFSLPNASHVELTIFNSLGQVVATLVNSEIQAGSHTVKWDAGNLSSGIYFYRLKSGNFVETQKMILMK